MKKLLILLSFISLSVFAADKQKHKDMTDWLTAKFLNSKSTTPNKALVYISNDTDHDLIGKQIVTIDSPDVSDGQVIIQRPTSTIDNQISISAMAGITLTSCQADFGEVTISASQLIVYTDRLPVGVKCIGSGGMKMYFQTFQE